MSVMEAATVTKFSELTFEEKLEDGRGGGKGGSGLAGWAGADRVGTHGGAAAGAADHRACLQGRGAAGDDLLLG